MKFARVIGEVIATQKVPDLEGARLRLVQHEDHDGEPQGEPEVALDVVSADLDQRVVVVHSREAALTWEPNFVPVDLAIVGIVDHAEREV